MDQGQQFGLSLDSTEDCQPQHRLTGGVFGAVTKTTVTIKINKAIETFLCNYFINELLIHFRLTIEIDFEH